MISIDTNILIRFLVDDDPKQDVMAREIFKSALADGGIFISAFVIIETAWVLRGKKISRTDIHDALFDLLNTPNIFISQKGLIELALGLYINGKADFCDYVIVLDSKLHDAVNFQTFDEQLKKENTI